MSGVSSASPTAVSVSAAAATPAGSASPSSSQSAVDSKWNLPGATPSYVVSSFVKHLQPMRALRGGSKQYVTAFARWYFSRKPQLSAQDVRLLLLGDGERKGVMETCGALKGLTAGAAASELRGSAVLALELLLMLLDVSVNAARAEGMLQQLQQAWEAQLLTLRLLASMRLERHLLSSSSSSPRQPEFACKLAFILEEALPQLRARREAWLGGAEAVRLYERWRQERAAALEAALAAEAEEDDDAELTSWQQVKLDDVDAADLQANAALAELIDDVDAEAEREGGQKDPLGLSTRLVPVQRQQQDGRDGMGRAGRKMQQLWQQMTAAPADGSRQSQSAAQSPAAQQQAAQHELMAAVLPARGGISTDSDDFSPVQFLCSVHKSTPLAALHRGLSHLQRSVNNRQAALRLLVAEHFGQYVYCLDTIDHLHQLMGSEVADSASRAVRIRQLLDAINRDANATFGSVMERKAGSDRMRATLQALHSHRFLFAMTGELQQHADGRQWPQLVRLYEKAKHCIVLTEQGAAAADLPSLVLQEVFARFSAVRASLFRQLSQPQLPLDEQVRAIAVLQQLDCDVDPAWYFLQQQTKAVCRQMEAAVQAAAERAQPQQQHEEAAGAAAAASDSPLPLAWTPFGSLLLANPAVLGPPASAAADCLPPLSPSARYASEPGAASQLQHLIHRLCSVVSHAVPDILRLAQLVATRQLGSLNQTAATAAAAAATPPAPSAPLLPSSAAAALAGVSASDRAAIQSLLSRLLHDFSAYVRLALFPLTADTLRLWQQQQAQLQQHEQQAAGGADSGGFSPPSSPQPQRSPPAGRLPPVLSIPASPRQADGQDDAAAAAGRPSQLSGAAFAAAVNRAAEHDRFSLAELTAASPSSASLLPLVPAPPTPSALPLPVSVQQSVSELLRCHSHLQELQPALPADSLQPVSALRSSVIRWFVAQTLHSARAAIAELEAQEDWSIAPVEQAERTASRRLQQSAQRQRTTMRHTALPARFHAVMQACIAAFTAVPSLRAKWLIKLIAAPALDCMTAFAHTLQRLTERQHESSTRLLLLLTNARHSRLHVLPGLLLQLLALFPASTHPVLTAAFHRSVSPPFELLDDALLQLLLRLQLSRLHACIRDSAYSSQAVQSLLLLSQRAAASASASASSLRTRGCVIAALLDVVGVHAELFFLCPALLPRCMQAMQAAALQSVLWCLSNELRPELWQQQPQLADSVLLEADFILAVLQPSLPPTTAAVSASEAQQGVADIARFLYAACLPGATDQRDDGEAERWLAEGRQRRAPQLKRDLDRTAAMFACFQPAPAASSSGGRPRQRKQQPAQPLSRSNGRTAQHQGEDDELDDDEQDDLQLEDEDEDEDEVEVEQSR